MYENICKQLDALILDEENAASEYTIFKHKFGEDYPYDIINSIATDEQKHAILLKEMKAKICKPHPRY